MDSDRLSIGSGFSGGGHLAYFTHVRAQLARAN